MTSGRRSSTNENGGLLVVAGHAIYQRGKWYGGRFEGEDRFYEQHVLEGLRVARAEGYEAMALSGGHTRDRDPNFPSQHVTNSEGEGMLEFLAAHGLLGATPPLVLAESYARDSFENIFYSILCFYREFKQWPSRVGVVSWKLKAVRFYLIASGLKLGDGRFFFYGSGDPISQSMMKTVAAANAKYDASIVRFQGKETHIVDPLHRHPEEFGDKRVRRMRPQFANNGVYLTAVKAAYDVEFDGAAGQQGIVGETIDAVERVEPDGGWEIVLWPWESSQAAPVV